jgi:hypothetical protein
MEDVANLAMGEYVERFRRVEALARSREQVKGWDYEGWLDVRVHATARLLVGVRRPASSAAAGRPARGETSRTAN